MGYMDESVLCSDKVRIMPMGTLYHFGVLESNVHMAWMRAICGKRQTMRLTLNETPLFYERRGFLHSSGSSDDQGIRSSNSAGSIFPCLSQRFGSSVRIYLK